MPLAADLWISWPQSRLKKVMAGIGALADAVRQNMSHFDLNDDDLVLILSGDQLYRMDFDELVREHCEHGADVTIAGTLLPKEDVTGLGLMRIKDNLEIEEFVEKPSDPKGHRWPRSR